MSKPKYRLGAVVRGPGNISGTILNIWKDSKVKYKYVVKPDGKKPVVWAEGDIK